jgi:tetratricopeptide (TPR) repeat protein
METPDGQTHPTVNQSPSAQKPARKIDWVIPIASIILVLLFTFLYFRIRQNELDQSNDYLRRGEKAYTKGDLNTAIIDFTQSIQLNPKAAQAYYHRGLAYVDQKDIPEAIADFNKALELCGSDLALCQDAQLQIDKVK